MLSKTLNTRTSKTQSLHWSAYNMQVAHVQEAHPSRNVIHKRVWQDMDPNFPDLKDSSSDWTVYP